MIRKCRESDVARMAEIESLVFPNGLGADFYRESLSNPLAFHLALEEDGKVLGFISSFFDQTTVEILNFAIHPKFQNQKKGTLLLRRFLTEIHRLGGTKAILDVRASNVRAIHLYQKTGFRLLRIRKQYYENSEDALVLECDLTARSNF